MRKNFETQGSDLYVLSKNPQWWNVDQYSPTAVYRYFTDDGRLIYVGITDCLETRDAAHRKSKEWRKLARYRFSEMYPSRAAAEMAETILISEGTPFNFRKGLRHELRRHMIDWFLSPQEDALIGGDPIWWKVPRCRYDYPERCEAPDWANCTPLSLPITG